LTEKDTARYKKKEARLLVGEKKQKMAAFGKGSFSGWALKGSRSL